MDERTAYKQLGAHKDRLTRQQIQTLRGQIRSGKADEAMKGLAKILARK